MRHALLALALLGPALLHAQDGYEASAEEEAHWDEEAAGELDIDSLIASFQWRTGEIRLLDEVAVLNLSPAHKFLSQDQAYHLLVDVWGNPPSLTDGLQGVVIQSDAGVYADRPAYLIYHEWSGYIADAEADGIDYAAKLKDMLREDSLENAEREALGYSGLRLIGWALPPWYDRERKALHWAKELVKDGSDRRVLNYNVKLLGRHGILTVNAITTMDRLDEVRAELPVILDALVFSPGYRYADYDPRTDRESSTGFDALIDGKERDRTVERLLLALKVAAGGFIGLLLLLIGLWHLLRKRRS